MGKTAETDKSTKLAKWLLKYGALLLFGLSFLSLFFVFAEGISKYDLSFRDKDSFNKFLLLFENYTGLYSATFILLASYYTLSRYILNIASNERGILRLETQLVEIQERKEKETIESTLVECKYFYTEIIQAAQDLYVASPKLGKMINKRWETWDFTIAELIKVDSTFLPTYDKLDETVKALVLTLIAKIEFTSIAFLSGTADEDIGFRAIGKEYCAQVEAIYSLIAMHRDSNKSNFENYFSRTVVLYNKWRKQLYIELNTN